MVTGIRKVPPSAPLAKSYQQVWMVKVGPCVDDGHDNVGVTLGYLPCLAASMSARPLPVTPLHCRPVYAAPRAWRIQDVRRK